MWKTLVCLLAWLSLTLRGDCHSLLDQLLAHQRQSYPLASVTSGFYDPRGPSRYRSRPGLHLGYDIAMPAGALARAAWKGRVLAIVPWAEGEWGVSVLHADGSQATYGHIRPAVSVGQQLDAGACVGWIARDHLDVKMRDSRGLPLDYAGVPGVAITAPEALVVIPPRLEELHQKLVEALRQPPDRHDYTPQQWERMVALGLVSGPLPTTNIRPPFTEYLRLRGNARGPAWSEADRAHLKLREQRLNRLELGLQHGLVALNEVKRARRELAHWRRCIDE